MRRYVKLALQNVNKWLKMWKMIDHLMTIYKYHCLYKTIEYCDLQANKIESFLSVLNAVKQRFITFYQSCFTLRFGCINANKIFNQLTAVKT